MSLRFLDLMRPLAVRFGYDFRPSFAVYPCLSCWGRYIRLLVLLSFRVISAAETSAACVKLFLISEFTTPMVHPWLNTQFVVAVSQARRNRSSKGCHFRNGWVISLIGTCPSPLSLDTLIKYWLMVFTFLMMIVIISSDTA